MPTLGGKPAVLLVDDDPDHALILAMSLGNEGFDVRVASSCAEARRALGSAQVDAVVTDWSLGDGTALDVISALAPEAPCARILLSGLDIEDRRGAFHARFLKPTSAAQVASAIRALLRPRTDAA